jgi:hypothetical protein
MPRQNRRRRDTDGDADGGMRAASVVGERHEDWRGETYVVRGVTAHGASKSYRCPGCDQLIAVGRPHLVVWPAEDDDAGDRRHWHVPCWAARDRRSPGVQRGRSAPRY